MKHIFIVLNLIFLFSCNSKLKYSDEIVFHGTLLEDVKLSPGCGSVAWATVFKFRCDKVFIGEYNKPIIYVAQNCPESLGDSFFKKSKKYKIVVNVKNKVKYDFVLENKYKDEINILFWSRNIEEIILDERPPNNT